MPTPSLADYGAPVTAVARNPGQLDIWAVANDGNLWSAAWSDASGWSDWFSLGTPPDTFFAPGTPVAANARSQDVLYVWAVAEDGRVWDAVWLDYWNWDFTRLSPSGGLFPGAHLTAVRGPGFDAHTELFAIGIDGNVWSREDSPAQLPGWFSLGAPASRFTPKTPVAAVARDSEHLDIWAVANDGQVWSRRRMPGADPPRGFARAGEAPRSGQGDELKRLETRPVPPDVAIGTEWSGWFSLGAPGGGVSADPEGAAFWPARVPWVTALSRKPGQLDIWVVANDRNLWSAAWSAASGWSAWFSLGAPPGGFRKGTPAAAVTRKPEQLDVWAVGNDGKVWSTAWSDSSGWSVWFSLGAPPAGFAVKAPITALARMPTQLDLWGVAKDGHVWSTYWAEASGWAGWFQL